MPQFGFLKQELSPFRVGSKGRFYAPKQGGSDAGRSAEQACHWAGTLVWNAPMNADSSGS
jgi:hypothetical protein